jgi:MFS family permease
VKSLSAFWALVVMAGFAELGYVTLNLSAMPVYLREVVGLGESTITVVGSAFLLTEAIFRAPMGMLSDHFGRRRLIVLGPMLTVFTSLATLVASHPLHFIVLRALDGLGAAMLWPAVYAAIGDSVPLHKRAWAMSFLNMTYMSGIALGPLAGGLVNDPLRREASLVLSHGVPVHRCNADAWRFYPRDGRMPDSADGKSGEKLSLGAFLNALRIAPGHMLLAFVVFSASG